MGACTDPVATNTIPLCTRKKTGWPRGFSREAFWWAVRPWRNSTLSSSCPADQEDAGGAGSNAILGRGPWRFGGGWRLAERERPRGCWVLAGWGAETAGAGFAGCWVGAVLGRLWAAAWAGALGQGKCRIACDAFCASVKRSANPSTTGPKRPLGEIGASRKETLSASLISVSVSHRWSLEHYQAGHRPSYGLGGSLGGSQSQVRCASQLPESRRIRLRLLYGREELGLIDLENRHRVERRSRLSSWSVGASSERWSGPAWLGRVTGLRLRADGSGWAEMCSHWLIQLRHPLISLFFSAVQS